MPCQKTTSHSIRFTSLLGSLAGVALCVAAMAASRSATGPAAPVEIEDLRVTPPDVKSPVRRTTVVTRGGPDLRVYLFAPQELGATSRSQPTFYWYLTKQIEDDTEIVLYTTQIER